MARKTIDYDELRKLLEQDPHMPRWEMAKRLTEHNERMGRPGLIVTPRAVITAIWAKKHEWGIETEPLRHDELIPQEWYDKLDDPQGTMETHLRNLRALARIRKGEFVPSDQRRRAMNMEKDLRARKFVIDLEDGKIVERPALPSETDSKGDLLDIVARTESAAEKIQRLLPEVGPDELTRLIEQARDMHGIR